MLKSSAKFLTSQSYHRRVTNGEQVLSRLEFIISGNSTFESVTTPLVPQLRSVFECYLRGVGHPLHPQMSNLIDVAQRDIDNANPAYRACRFVKLLSGITLLPPPGQFFTVRLFFSIVLSR